jgi:hypothetical protein
VPAQNRISRNKRRHLAQRATAQTLSAPRQPTALLVAQPQSPPGELTPERAVFLDQIRDDVLLLVIQPAEHAARKT